MTSPTIDKERAITRTARCAKKHQNVACAAQQTNHRMQKVVCKCKGEAYLIDKPKGSQRESDAHGGKVCSTLAQHLYAVCAVQHANHHNPCRRSAQGKGEAYVIYEPDMSLRVSDVQRGKVCRKDRDAACARCGIQIIACKSSAQSEGKAYLIDEPDVL
eukprot:2935828-Pleurochrysis_carterae.AAC.1